MKRAFKIAARYCQKLFLGGMAAILLCASASGPLLADTLPQLLQQGLPYYIPNDTDVCGGNVADTGNIAPPPSPGPVADTTTIGPSTLPPDITSAVEKLRPQYENAAKQADVPWQMLAGVHYRENSLRTNADLQAGNPIGGPYSRASTSYQNYGYPKTFEESLVIAGKELQDKAQAGIFHKKLSASAPDGEVVKDALFGYNGRAPVYAQQAAKLGFDPEKQPYEGSPYVMNRFDAKHTGMGIITHDHGPADGIDLRFGAYTIYAFLGGAAGTTNGCETALQGLVSGDFNKIILAYAWPDYRGSGYQTKKPEYAAAIDAAKRKGEYIGGCVGVDCGAFVTRVMRDSGMDPGYNGYNGNVASQKKWMDDHPQKYQKMTNVKDSSTLHPGDVWINSGLSHTYIFVGKIDGFSSNSASASLCDRSPMAEGGGAYDFGETWYRVIGK